MTDHRSPVGGSRVTPPEVFFDRRRFIQAATAIAAAPMAARAAPPGRTDVRYGRLQPPRAWPETFRVTRNEEIGLPRDLPSREPTPRLAAGSFNNFYEFIPGRAGPVWEHTDDFEVDPWALVITGECHQPLVVDLDDLDRFGHEERLYHFRCVERWAMNVPWTGFPLRWLLSKVRPTSNARYVRFVSANRADQMPGLAASQGSYAWPYHEALRIDEAMDDLVLVATGVYGEPLPKQHGAPVRIVVPWKYGYKSPKSIVAIELLAEQPLTFWGRPPYTHEYGFLSNVNPNIPHPRWSQARSHWLDDREAWFPTPIFNGYADRVAHLYPDEPTTPQEALAPGQTAR
ncbi:MAG: protein-methionine-sulfoxide reductase catalytic subunit MsrP [Planctomycetota bacterium]|jgi:sulfoxide reductase catalytic subunit YedY